MTRTEIQDALISNLPPKPHGLVQYAPRVGKGRVVCGVIKKNKPKKVLWVTLSAKLRDVDIPNEVKTWLGEEYLETVQTVCYSSLHKIEGHYDLIVLDEYQEVTEKNTTNLITGKLQYDYIFGATGTHPKDWDKQQILKSLKLRTLDVISIDRAVDLGLIAPYKIVTVPVKLNSTDLTVKAGSKEKPFYQTEAKSYKFWSDKIKSVEEELGESFYLRIKRRNLILQSDTKLIKAKELLRSLGGRTILFSGSIDSSKKLSPYTYNSKTDDEHLNQFLEGKINTLSLVNSGGVGFTYRDVDNFIIVQTDSDKNGNTTQKIARSLLVQKGYEARIYIIYLQDTVDEEWMGKALEGFNPERIEHLQKLK